MNHDAELTFKGLDQEDLEAEIDRLEELGKARAVYLGALAKAAKETKLKAVYLELTEYEEDFEGFHIEPLNRALHDDLLVFIADQGPDGGEYNYQREKI